MHIRESKEFWVVTDDGEVVRSTGYDCKPHNPDSWWFPSQGYTLRLGGLCFENRESAVAAARTFCDEKVKQLKKQLARFEAERNALG